jgi:hypothetical protein
MGLRELRQAVQNLPSIAEDVSKFKENWLKPIRSNTNSNLRFLQNLSRETRKDLNTRIAGLHEVLYRVSKGQETQDKMRLYGKYLVELKLSQLRGNNEKYELLTNSMLNDEFMNIKRTIREVKSLNQDVRELSHRYNQIIEFLHQEVTLEEAVFFMDLPHRLYLHNLLKTSKTHGHIMRDLGRHFVSIVKKAEANKK